MPKAKRSRTAIIVATHGGLAEALIRTAETIAGPSPGVIGLGLAPGEAPAAFEARLAAAVPVGAPALVLVDLFGGTPWNAASRLAHSRPRWQVVSGVNLPMLLEAVLAAGEPPASPDEDEGEDEGADVEQLARLAQQIGADAVRRRV